MEKIKWIKKGIGALLALNMVLSSVPLPAFAAGSDNLCEHHTEHTAECGYSEAVAGSPCTHTHSEDCYSILSCIHEHEEETCGVDNVDCTHECTVDNGCITMERDCHHVHGDCGYSEGAAEVPCGHVHDETCGYVAASEGTACGHTEHTDCGYAPATEGTPCTHVCEVKVNSSESCYKLLCSHKDGGHDEVCGYVAAVEGHECHYECAECAAAAASEEAPEESSDPAPVCTCAEACTAENLNEYCEVCDVDYTKCTGTDTAVQYAEDASPYAVIDTEAGTLTIDGTLGGKAEATDEDITALTNTIKNCVDSGITTVIVTGSELAIYNGFYDNYPAYAEALYYVTEEDENSKYCGSIDLILPDVTEIGKHEFNVAFSLKSVTLPKVTTIGDAAFWECMYLQTLTFGSVVTSIGSKVAFADVGFKVEGGTDLVLNCGQMQTEGNYKPNLETNEWGYNSSWEEVYKWESITLTHNPEADDGDCTTALICSACGETVVEAKESHTTELDENKATCQNRAKCDLCGTSYGEVDSENHTKDTCTNGFYDCCNAYQPAELVDGVYQIGNAGQLFWFAELVNSGTKNTNAVLTADIDLEGRTCTPIARTASYHASAITDTGYTGIFDGQNHEIRNFTVECAADGEGILSYGLFGTVSGTVKNLGVDSFSFDATAEGKADCRAGGIAGQVLTDGRIENCFAVNSSILTGSRIAGGIAGCNYGGTIANCFAYNNTVTGHSRCAAIVGDTVTDSGAPTKLIGYVTNCYADKAPIGSQNGGDTYITSCEQKSAEQFRSGEVAFLLGEAWGQTPGEGLPVLGGEPVKKASDGTYYNDIIQVTIVWTSMEFTYGETWNPETLQYEESWTASGDGAVTVTNEGTMTVNAEFAYEQKYKPVTGSFTQPLLDLSAKESETTQLILSGKPGEDLENQELGTITVTIHRATN